MTYKHWSNVAGPGDMTFVTTTAEGFRPVREPGGELLASFESGGSARYYHFDALGSTVLLSDSSGNPTSAYAYGAWGDVLASPASWQPYQYVGQLGYYTHTTSQGTELSDWLQLGVRFYQPEIGRFGQHGSPYTYANDSPVGSADCAIHTNALPKLPKPKDYAQCMGKAIDACRDKIKKPADYGKCIDTALLRCLGKSFSKVSCPDYVCYFARTGVIERLFPGKDGTSKYIRGLVGNLAEYDCAAGDPCRRKGWGKACCDVKALCSAIHGTPSAQVRNAHTQCYISCEGNN